MSFVDASTGRSPLAAASNLDDEEEKGPGEATETAAEEDQEEEPEEALPAEDRKGTLVEWLESQVEDINLARHLPQSLLDEIGMQVMLDYQLDENSRAEWLDEMQTAVKLALQETQPKVYPWPNASNVIFPLIGKAALAFGTVAYPAVIHGKAVVKGVVNGSDRGTPATEDGKPDGKPKVMPGPNGQPQPVWLIAPGEKRQRADRVAEHMSWQLLFEMKEWQAQTDQMLHQIPITGGAVRKTYRDDAEGRNRSLLVGLENMVWDYNAASFDDAPRHSEKLSVYPHDITTYERTGAEEDGDEGMWLHLDYGPGDAGQTEVKRADGEPVTPSSADDQAPHVFVEQHRRWDLDGDGYAEPYVVTVHARSSKTVRIVALYDKEGIKADKAGETIIKIDPVEHYTLIPFLPNLKGGSYPMGFGHLLKHLNEAIDTTLNQMFDAGTLQNAGGGFIGDQLGVASGQVNFSVGQYKRVTTKGQSIRDAVFPIPFAGPSQVLFQLLGVLMEAGKDIAGLQNVLSGDAAMANAPPTTILALIEQGMKLYTAIHKRIYTALGSEFAKLYRLNRLHIGDAERYRVGDEWREVHPDDYRLGGGVEPIADPDMITDMQKLGRAQLLMTVKDEPGINKTEVFRRLFTAANIDRPDDLFEQPDPQQAQMQQQMAMAKFQADLGRTRAAEQKDATQAFLNLALARKASTAQEEAFINAQLTFLRLHIEALNTQVKAAGVDHKFHDTGMRGTIAHAGLAADMAQQGAESGGGGAQPTPEPEGAFPTAPDAPPALPAAAGMMPGGGQ